MKRGIAMNKQELNEIDKLIHFLVASARGCMDEPAIYGPLRLLETASRLLTIVEGYDAEYSNVKNLIDDNKYLSLSDETEFTKALDGLIMSLARKTSKGEK